MPFTKNDIENIYEVYNVRKIDIVYYDFTHKLSSEYVAEMKKYFYD